MMRSDPQMPAIREPPTSSTSCSSNWPGTVRWRSWPTTSGRCCSRVPPAATFISWKPRQMPSSGRSVRARLRQGELELVPLGPGLGGVGSGLGTVGGRVDVGAAAEDQAVEPVEQRDGVCGDRRVGRQQERDGAGLLDGHRVAVRREVGELVPGAPAGRLGRRRDADQAGRLSPLEALETPEALPVGDRGLEGLDFELGPAHVVADDFFAEGLVGQFAVAEKVAGRVHVRRHALGVRGVGVAVGRRRQRQFVVDPLRPAAIIALSARYGLTSAPGRRFSSRRPSPWPTTRSEQVRLSLPQVTEVGANEAAAKRL